MVGEGGIKGGLALAIADREAAAAGAQAEMFADADDAPLPLSRARSGPKGGRPAGSRNRSTEQWRQHVLSRYASPLVGLLEIAGRDVRTLAVELELFARDEDGNVRRDQRGEPVLAPGALIEALKIQKGCLEAALPYLHQKQPVAVELPAEGLRGGMMQIIIGDAAGQSDTLGLGIIEHEQNQQLTDAVHAQSDTSVSGTK